MKTQRFPLVSVVMMIPDIDQIPVKRPLTTKDFPLPDLAEISPVLQELQKANSFFSKLTHMFSQK